MIDLQRLTIIININFSSFRIITGSFFFFSQVENRSVDGVRRSSGRNVMVVCVGPTTEWKVEREVRTGTELLVREPSTCYV